MLNFPVNHCELSARDNASPKLMMPASFSPDLKTLVSVGDSTDVQLFEVIDGGREFREIATYHGKLI
jgi:hypothetical protein